MYEIEGTITFKVSRSELDLLINSLKLIIKKPFVAAQGDGVYSKLLRDLLHVEEQWTEKEQEYYKNKALGAGK